MPYIYELSFDIPAEKARAIDRVGARLDRVVAYLRSILPDFEGYWGSRGMYSIDTAGVVRIRYESTWENWHDMEEHLRSGFQEAKVFERFGHVAPDDMMIRIYEEVGTRG
jgi:hypothetical protein